MTDLINQIVEEKIESEKDVNLIDKLLNFEVEENFDEKINDVLVLILRQKSVENEIDFSSFEMCGKKCIEYVENACSQYETKIVEFDEKMLKEKNLTIFDEIKQHLSKKRYTLVFFANTPLLTRKTVNDIVEYFLMKRLSCLEFNYGYMFETDYLKSVSKIYNPHKQNFCEEDFIKVCDNEMLYVALAHLKMRIIKYHLNNEVIFLDTKSAFIDADVNIEKNVIIGENVKICGKSVIKQNCQIYSSKLNKVIVEENVKIENSVVENSVVFENATILDFSVLKNQTINKNEKIENEKRV